MKPLRRNLELGINRKKRVKRIHRFRIVAFLEDRGFEELALDPFEPVVAKLVDHKRIIDIAFGIGDAELSRSLEAESRIIIRLAIDGNRGIIALFEQGHARRKKLTPNSQALINGVNR